MRCILLALMVAMPLFTGCYEALADQNRPFSSRDLGCEFFPSTDYDGAVTFYNRDMKLYTLDPEWKSKYHSARCVRYCKAFLYEKPQLKVFYGSFDTGLNVRSTIAKAQSMRIFCTNDGAMHTEEVREKKAADAARQAQKNSGRKKIILVNPNLQMKKLP